MTRVEIAYAQGALEAAKQARIKAVRAKWLSPDGTLMELSNRAELERDAAEKEARAEELIKALKP